MGEMLFDISSLSFDGFPAADDSPLQDVVYKILFLVEATPQERTADNIIFTCLVGGTMGAENNTPLLSREEYYFELSVLDQRQAAPHMNFRIVDRSEKKKKCAKVCKICNSVGVTTVTVTWNCHCHHCNNRQ